MEEWIITYVAIPLLIFTARILDVSLGTLRIVFIAKGFKRLAPILGFVEILIWIIAISKIIQHIDNWVYYLAYAGGFAMGSYVGMIIEEKLAIGLEMVRVVTRRDAMDLRNVLREKGFGVTYIPAEGSEGEVGVLYTIVNRNQLKETIAVIQQYNPRAFYTIEDIRFVSKGYAAQLQAPLKTRKRLLKRRKK